VIVAIDEASLATHGQWPWPRTMLARIVEAIAAESPAAIGIDILMPEPDRLSPDRLSALVSGMDAEVAERLRRLPGNDAVLAQVLRPLPVVVGLAGLDALEPTASVSGLRAPPVRSFGGDPRPFVKRFAAALKSVDEIDGAAAGHGLLGVNLDAGVARRIPLAAAIGPTIVPTLGLEMLRVASGAPTLAIHVDPRGIRAVGVGDLLVPTEPDGSMWIHYSRHDPARFVSAADVLSGKVEGRAFHRKLVLIGVTALGLSDYLPTPVAERMAGAEIHAQMLESLFDEEMLSRPRSTPWLEAALLAAGGLVLIWMVPALPVRAATALAIPVIGVPAAIAAALYVKLHVLFDGASPAVALSVVFTAMLGVALADAERQRRALRHQVARQREAAARLAGELEAARRIQMGSLPSAASAFPGEKRFELYAVVEPAREVGGDLYDFFALDADRICLLIGDVAGKGLPGCLFMAMTKSLFKSVALGGARDAGSMVSQAGREICRDNAEGLFVTLWAGVLDVATGQLAYCNAGHEPPHVVAQRGRGLERLSVGGGPPLCVLDEFPYATASHRLRPGDTLCLVTDGITEATSATGEFYGRERLEALLAGLPPDTSATALGEAILGDVARFAAGVDAADDLAIVALRWHGG
jgi:serine phosphatase RsbU (regulator of sigma subunit)/CHASE2 domain-containing sensor protein